MVGLLSPNRKLLKNHDLQFYEQESTFAAFTPSLRKIELAPKTKNKANLPERPRRARDGQVVRGADAQACCAKQDAPDKSQDRPTRALISAQKRGSKSDLGTSVVGVKQSQLPEAGHRGGVRRNKKRGKGSAGKELW
jgi:hypothetical protein